MEDRAIPYLDTVEQVLPIGYNKNGVWYDIAVVREMRAIDNQVLVTPEALHNGAKGITALLTQVVQSLKSSDPDAPVLKFNKDIARDMYIADRDMCVIATRKLSLGNDIPIRHKCENCGEKIEFTLPLDALETKILDRPQNPFYDVELRRGIQFTENGPTYKDIILTYLKGSHQENVSILAKSNPTKAALDLVFRSIHEVKELEDSLKTFDIVANMRQIDIAEINKALKEHEVGPDLQPTSICGYCDNEVIIPLGLPTLFRTE